MAIALLFGVIASMLIAWRLGAVPPNHDETVTDMSPHEAREMWIDIVGQPYDNTDLEGNTVYARGKTWAMCVDHETLSAAADELFASAPPPASWTDKAIMCEHIEVGWPTRCLYGDVVVVLTLTGEQRLGRRGWLYHAGDSLPIGPLWLGLVINTVFYGACAYAMLALISRVRRRARLDRARCPECTYDLRASLPTSASTLRCAECGCSWDAALFARPRQLLRWWLAPLVLPMLVMFGGLALAYFDWHELRFHLRWNEPLVSWINGLIMLAAVTMILFPALSAYADRPAGQRCALLALVILLTAVSYACLFALVVHFSNPT